MKLVLENPFINRISGAGSPQIVITPSFIAADGIAGGGSMTFKIANKEDFVGATTSSPSSYEYWTGTAWTNVVSATIVAADIAKKLRFTLGSIGADAAKYFKAVYTEGAKIYESPVMVFTSFMEINFQLKTAIDFGNVKPKKVSVRDRINATVATAYTIKVEACNNAFDLSPTWEDITAAYMAQDFFTFKNTVKTDVKWGILVRYSITKNAVSDQVEFDEFYISHI